jgi:hypothetical protein
MITAIVIFFASIIGILLFVLILFTILRSRQKNRTRNHLADNDKSTGNDGV